MTCRKRAVMRRFSLRVSVLLAVCAASSLNADERLVDGLTISKLRTQFLTAKGGSEKGTAAKRLLAGLTSRQVQRLVFDEDPSVAICAAWRRLDLQMRARFVGADRNANRVGIRPGVSREFLGFIEGRLHIPAPDGWTQNLLTAKYFRWGAVFFTIMEPASPELLFDTEPTSAELTLEQLAVYSRNSRPLVQLALEHAPAYAMFIGGDSYEGQDASAYLPEEISTVFKSELELSGSLVPTGLATEGRAFIALPGDGPEDAEVVCLATERKNPQVLWRRKMDSYWSNAYRGQWWFTEFRLKGELLYLFHSMDESIGIECLRISDGRRIFSFNSCLP